VAQNKMLLGISVERDESSIKSIAGKKWARDEKPAYK